MPAQIRSVFPKFNNFDLMDVLCDWDVLCDGSLWWLIYGLGTVALPDNGYRHYARVLERCSGIISLQKSFVITTDRVSTLSRTGALGRALSFSKETCGQTLVDISICVTKNFRDERERLLTSSMVASFCIVHHEEKWLSRCLLFKPIPSSYILASCHP